MRFDYVRRYKFIEKISNLRGEMKTMSVEKIKEKTML